MAKIQVTIDVPDGDLCEGCDLWYRAESHKCYCLIFGMQELQQRYKQNMVQGTEILKCQQCKDALLVEVPNESK